MLFTNASYITRTEWRRRKVCNRPCNKHAEYEQKPVPVREEEDMRNILETTHLAEELIAAKAQAQKSDAKQLEMLPMLKPGQITSRESCPMGFRYKDGYRPTICTSGICKLSNERSPDYDDAIVHNVLLKWPSGMAWCYWTNLRVGPGVLTLEECMIQFGTAIMEYTEDNGKQRIRFKIIYLDKSLNIYNSFVLFRYNYFTGMQTPVDDYESDLSVKRIYRSDVPQELQNAILLVEAIALKKGSTYPHFWEM
jgi:hypothetical protein